MNSIEDIQKSFKDLLHSLLNSLNEGFDVNELAYLKFTRQKRITDSR